MNVKLSGDAERFVRREVTSGRYESAQEVIRDSLRLLQEREVLEERRRERLGEQIEVGLAQLNRGEGIPGKQVFEALRDKSRRRRHRAS
ncbi:MAG: type II toxin-antitoxin system ParD family antitoxin [bacterium]|nr:type II toxin-antitoxin system ParD family antitoxin [bacterium]